MFLSADCRKIHVDISLQCFIVDCALTKKIIRINGLPLAFLFGLRTRTAWVHAQVMEQPMSIDEFMKCYNISIRFSWARNNI